MKTAAKFRTAFLRKKRLQPNRAFRRRGLLRALVLGGILFASTALSSFAQEESTEAEEAAQQVRTATTPENYQLSIRDRVQLVVYGEPDLDIEQRIDGRGQVRIPLLGTARIAGMTVREAEQYLERAFVEKRFLRNPMLSIRVADYASKEVAVLGAVASPGKLAFPIEANALDIVDVISQMGGFTGIAKSNEVRVTRVGENGEETDFTVNVERMITGRGRGEEEARVDIFPGDVIWVPERLF